MRPERDLRHITSMVGGVAGRSWRRHRPDMGRVWAMNQNVKIGIAAGALVIGGVLIARVMMSGGPDGGPVGKQPFVNVTTGEIVYLSQRAGDFKTLPAADKKGKFTLFPIEKNEADDWILIEKYRGGLQDGFKNGWFTPEELKIDAETFKVSADE